MYYTLTFNPSLDHYVWFKTALLEGAILRPFQSALKVGGKGLNINQNFAKLKIPSKSFVFLAGDVGQMIYNKISKIPMIETEAFWIKGESRINTKILGEKETAINEPGPLIDEGAKRELLKSLKKLDVNDFLIIAGSLAFNVDLNYLLEIKSTCKAKLVLDIPNLSFLDLSRLKPDLIKPNLEELGAIFEEEVSIDNYRCYTRKLITAGVKSVLLSLGEMGSYFESDKEAIWAKGPKVKVVSTVGCGDTLLSYFLAFSPKGTKKGLIMAEAAGRTKVQSVDLVELEDVLRMSERIELF